VGVLSSELSIELPISARECWSYTFEMVIKYRQSQDIEEELLTKPVSMTVLLQIKEKICVK